MHARLILRSLLAAPALAAAGGLLFTSAPVRGIDLGRSRLVAAEPFAPGMADSCTWEVAAPDAPASQGPSAGPSRSATRTADGTETAFEGQDCRAPGCRDAEARKPIRKIEDPYAGFSAIALDLVRDEVVLVDEFDFDILVYDRLAATPPAARRTEPKRVIGGPRTESQYVSGVHVDPKNGDIYAVNNDSVVGLNVYARTAQGDVPPSRAFHSPYGAFGMAVDEDRQELLFTVQHDGAVVAWPKAARGEDRPTRLLQGDRTQMGDPHGIAIDPKNRLMFVANYGTSRLAVPGPLGTHASTSTPRIPNWPAGNLWPRTGGPGYRHEIVPGTGRFGPPSITVFPLGASGNVAPLRVIQGPNAQLNWPTGVAVDADRGEIYVTNAVGDSVNVFRSDAQGDAAPIRVLKGPQTLLKNPTGVVVDPAHDEVWVTNFGNHTATAYRRNASGNAAPVRIIRSAPLEAPTTLISNPYSVAFDSTRNEILVPNCVAHPRIAAYTALADKNATPVRIIEGQATLLNRTVHSIAYDAMHDEIVVQSNIGQAILTFRGGAKGEEAPIRVIRGPKTGLRDPEKIFVDPVHHEIFVINMTIKDEILVFDRRANGDVAPIRVLKGPDTRLNADFGAVDPVHDVIVVGGRHGLSIYDRTAEGNTKPLRVISGPKSGVSRAGKLTVYPPTGKIIANAGAGGEDDDGGFIGVWSIEDNGDVPPLWILRGPGGGLTVDPRNKTVITSSKPLNAVLSYSLPELFQ
jgi:DNA-binding beta-propeller fold protein YncE